MPETNGNGAFREKMAEFKGGVAVELKNIRQELNSLSEENDKQWIQIRNVQMKAAAYGSIAGIVVGVVTSIITASVISILRSK